MVKLAHWQMTRSKVIMSESRVRMWPLEAIGTSWLSHGNDMAGEADETGKYRNMTHQGFRKIHLS